MGDKAQGELQSLAKDANPRYRARALWLLGKMDGNGQKTVDQALADDDADIRCVAVRLGRELAAAKTEINTAALLKAAAADKSPAVRRECAIALADLNPDNRAQLWAQLASQHDGKDRWYLEALGIGARGHWDESLAAWLESNGGKWNTPAARDVIWRSRAKATPALLAKIIQDKATTEEEKPRYVRAFDFLKGPEKDEALKSLLGL